MKFSQSPWTALLLPSVAASALLLSLGGCSPSESQASTQEASTPAPPEPKAERTALATETQKPIPPPEPLTQPEPIAKPVPEPLPEPETRPLPADPPKDPPKDPAPVPAPKPADVSVSGFELGSAVGPDGHVTEPKSVFAPTDSVRLAVLADGAPRLVRLSVEWYGPDALKISEDVQDVTLNGSMAVPFTLSNAKGLALGAYRAEIRIEGWLASTAHFSVQ